MLQQDVSVWEWCVAHPCLPMQLRWLPLSIWGKSGFDSMFSLRGVQQAYGTTRHDIWDRVTCYRIQWVSSQKHSNTGGSFKIWNGAQRWLQASLFVWSWMVSSLSIASLVAKDTLSGDEATFFSSAATYRPRKTATNNSLIKSKRPPACQMMYLTEEMCMKVMSCSLMRDICVRLNQSWLFDLLHTQCSRPSEPSPPFSLT